MMFDIAHDGDNPLNGLSRGAPLLAVGVGHWFASARAARREQLAASGAPLAGIMRGAMDLLCLRPSKLTIDGRPLEARRCEDAAASPP